MEECPILCNTRHRGEHNFQSPTRISKKQKEQFKIMRATESKMSGIEWTLELESKFKQDKVPLTS